MKKTNICLLVAASTAALTIASVATPAAAGEPYATISVGSASVETSNMGPLSPEGTVINITAGDVLFDRNGFTVAIEAGAAFGNVEASVEQQTCDVPDCGYNEWLRQTDTVDGTISAGVRVAHPVGDFVLSAGFGVAVSRYTENEHYTNDGGFPDFHWQDREYAVGTYWDLGVSYPLNNDWAVIGRYSVTDQVVDEWSMTYGGNKDGVAITSWSVGFGRVF